MTQQGVVLWEQVAADVIVYDETTQSIMHHPTLIEPKFLEENDYVLVADLSTKDKQILIYWR